MVTLEDVGLTVVGRTLFEGVTWTIQPHDRVGLVGPNGSGKTSLLRIIARRDEPHAGRVRVHPGLRVAFLPQEVETEIHGEAPLVEATLAAADEVRRLGAECRALEDEMAAAAVEGPPERLERVTRQYGERRALFEWFGGDHLETRAKTVLGGLGFSSSDFDRPVRTFSGGWRMRAMMARLLVSGADLLLLDEPTNHLDLDALAWLEKHLAASPAAMVIVSHDRVFLEKVANKIADLVRSRLRVTPGAWSAWVKARAAEQERTERRGRQLAREAERLSGFVERFHAKATKAAAARDKARLLDKVQAERAQLERDPARRWVLRWPDPPDSPDLLVRLDGVSKRYDGRAVFEDVTLEIRRGQRFAVLGGNGAGKTTLLRIVGGETLPDGGRREFAPGLRVGVFAQHQLEALDPARGVFDEAARGAGGRTPEEIRRALGALGLSDLHVDRPVASLSGGERARLALAKLVLRPAQLLLLDEPTNHLDLPLREALEQALAAWPGAMLVVSHDRAFLDRLTTASIAVEGGRVLPLDGGWNEWLSVRGARPATEAGSEDDAGAIHERSRAGRRARAEALQERTRRLRPLREDVARLEREIAQAETRLGEVDALLADPTIHAHGEQMRSLAREREALETSLGRLYPAWEEAARRLETAEGQEG